MGFGIGSGLIIAVVLQECLTSTMAHRLDDDDDDMYNSHAGDSRSTYPTTSGTSGVRSDLPSFRSSTINQSMAIDVGDDEEEETQVRELMRRWMDERNATDILPWQGELVQQILHKLQGR
jgi:hypothetical protein